MAENIMNIVATFWLLVYTALGFCMFHFLGAKDRLIAASMFGIIMGGLTLTLWWASGIILILIGAGFYEKNKLVTYLAVGLAVGTAITGIGLKLKKQNHEAGIRVETSQRIVYCGNERQDAAEARLIQKEPGEAGQEQGTQYSV